MIEYILPCPHCNQIGNTQYYHHPGAATVDIMCWDQCGMDFTVNYLWFMLNRIEVEE